MEHMCWSSKAEVAENTNLDPWSPEVRCMPNKHPLNAHAKSWQKLWPLKVYIKTINPDFVLNKSKQIAMFT